MKTQHRIYFDSSISMQGINDGSVDLVVTSPPYPMIEMWDNIFSLQNPEVKKALKQKNGMRAFELMHQVLDSIWDEVYRVVKEGGFICINIGDATRTINGDFTLYPNHMRVLHYFLGLGLTPLPCILWRKQTNAPNKFMGSGTLPAGAYVTLEHEYILILRKGLKRKFTSEIDKKRRRESAIFWEERNNWYSDVWFDVKGTLQNLNDKVTRLRSGAYPFEIVYRIVNMYSVKGDVVLDPFLGTGTTTAASMVSGRNSVSFEIDATLRDIVNNSLRNIDRDANLYISNRINNHLEFIKSRKQAQKPIKYHNIYYGFSVIMSQERELYLNEVASVEKISENLYEVVYSDMPENCLDYAGNQTDAMSCNLPKQLIGPSKNFSGKKGNQLTLF